MGIYDGGIYTNKWAIVYDASLTAATDTVEVLVDLATDLQWSISVVGNIGSTGSDTATLKLYLNGDTDDENYEGSVLSYTSDSSSLAPAVAVGPEVYRATASGDIYTEVLDRKSVV